MKTKLISISMALLLLLSLTACGGTDNSGTPKPTTTPDSQTGNDNTDTSPDDDTPDNVPVGDNYPRVGRSTQNITNAEGDKLAIEFNFDSYQLVLTFNHPLVNLSDMQWNGDEIYNDDLRIAGYEHDSVDIWFMNSADSYEDRYITTLWDVEKGRDEVAEGKYTILQDDGIWFFAQSTRSEDIYYAYCELNPEKASYTFLKDDETPFCVVFSIHNETEAGAQAEYEFLKSMINVYYYAARSDSKLTDCVDYNLNPVDLSDHVFLRDLVCNAIADTTGLEIADSRMIEEMKSSKTKIKIPDGPTFTLSVKNIYKKELEMEFVWDGKRAYMEYNNEPGPERYKEIGLEIDGFDKMVHVRIDSHKSKEQWKTQEFIDAFLEHIG